MNGKFSWVEEMVVFVKNDTSQRTLFPKRDWSEAGEAVFA